MVMPSFVKLISSKRLIVPDLKDFPLDECFMMLSPFSAVEKSFRIEIVPLGSVFYIYVGKNSVFLSFLSVDSMYPRLIYDLPSNFASTF